MAAVGLFFSFLRWRNTLVRYNELTISTIKPLDIITKKSEITHKPLKFSPFYKTTDRDSALHLFRVDVKVDASQKRRQLNWLRSSKEKTLFNETVIVDTRKLVTDSSCVKSISIKAFNKLRD